MYLKGRVDSKRKRHREGGIRRKREIGEGERKSEAAGSRGALSPLHRLTH